MEKSKIKELICYFNIAVSCLAILHLFALQHLVDFAMKENIMVDAMHNGIFSDLAIKEDYSISCATMVIFITGLVALFFYWLFNRIKKEATAFGFLMTATGIHTIAGIYYLAVTFLWINRQFADSAFVIILYIVLLLLGIAVCVWGIFFYKNKGEGRTKKWIPILIYSVMAIVIVISMATPFYVLNEEHKSVNEVRQLVENQPDGYDENIGYQISNYCHGGGVYAEGTLYIHKYNSETGSSEIWSIDEQGNLSMLWNNPLQKTNFSVGIYYYDEHLYARVKEKDGAKKLIRISVSDGSTEVLYEYDNFMDIHSFGIKDDQFLLAWCDEDFNIDIYSYPVNGPISKEDGTLYDTGIYNTYTNQTFVNRYLYNNQSAFMLSFGSNEWPYASIEDSVYNIVYYGGDTNYCGSLIKETLVYNAEEPIQETSIDSYVWRYNIFDDEIFYIKGEDTFEAWRCDPDGENKELIGTLPYSKYDSCYNLYMAEEYMVVYIKDRETKIDSAYLMWLDDGSCEKLW